MDANVTFAVVATSCPIATSLAFTVTPVPCPTARVLVAAIVPPPVRPAPAVIVTPLWSICSFATKFVVESWSTCAELLNKVLPNSVSAVVILVEKLALGAVNEPEILEAICAELDTNVKPNAFSDVVDKLPDISDAI